MKTPHRAGRRPARGLLAFGVASALAIAGCSASDDRETVVFWQFDTAEPAIEAYEAAITEFEAENPDIRIDMQIVPWTDQQQRITTALATGTLPDVSMMGNNVVAQYAAAGHLRPLTEYLPQWSANQGGDVLEDMYDGDIGYYVLDGELYGSPIAVETRMLYYNRDIFEQAGLDPDSPPDTWDEMHEAATQLRQTGVVPWSAPMSREYITVQTFMSVYLSYGARLFDDDGTCGMDTPQFRDALTSYTSIAEDGLTSPDAANATQDDVSNQFVTGQAGMLIEGPYVYNAIAEQNPDLIDDVGIAPIPAGPEGRFGFLGGWPLVMWDATDVPDASAAWIEFVTSPDGALDEIAASSGLLPGRVSMAGQPPWDEAPYTAFAEQLTDAYPYQYPSEPSARMGEIEATVIQGAVQQVATNLADVDQATQQLCTTVNEIVEG